MAIQYLIFAIVIFLQNQQANTACHPLDDVYFNGIYGPLYIREYQCVNSSKQDIQNYLSNLQYDGLIKIVDTDIGTLDKNFFPNKANSLIITLSMINCNINKIEPEGLRKLSKLYNLTITDSKFNTFDNTFVQNHNLRFQYLNLTNNNISNVDNICVGLPTIKRLILNRNYLQTINGHMFNNCPKLEVLDVSESEIFEINDNAFKNSGNITELFLNDNYLTEVKFKLAQLTFLNLSNNNFINLDTDIFIKFPQLKILDFSSNNINNLTISHVPENGVFELRQLYLRNNNFNEINITYFKKLQTLDLSYNKIDNLEVHFFEDFKELRHFYVRNNNIKTLPIGIFSPLTELIELDLSYNQLIISDIHILHPLSLLQTIYLGGSNIQIEPFSLFRHFSSLKRFEVTEKWPCEKLSQFLIYCNTFSVNCKPRTTDFTTYNINGIPCIDNKNQTTTSEKPREKILNPDFSPYVDAQNKYFELQITEFKKLNTVLILLIVIVVLYFFIRTFYSYFCNCFQNFAMRRHGSNIELVNPLHQSI